MVPCLWAGAFLTGSAALVRLSPETVSFLRFAVTIVAGAAVLRRPLIATIRARPDLKQWGAMLLLALLGGVTYHIVFYAGLARTQPPIASVVIATNPILTALGAALVFRHHRPARSLWIGLACAFVGVILLAMDKPIDLASRSAPATSFLGRLAGGWGLGETLCLVASLAWAAFAILMQRFRSGLLSPFPGAGVTVLVYALTAILLLPIVILTGGIAEIAVMTIGDWGCMLYLGVVATVIAYTLYNAGLDRVGSARVSQVTYAVPALTTILSLWFVASFDPTASTWSGLALVTIGLLVSDGRAVHAIRNRFGD